MWRLMGAMVLLMAGCKPAVYGGFEAVVQGKYQGSGWEASNPTGVVGIEFDQILDDFMFDNFSFMARIEHRSDPRTTDDGYGQQSGGFFGKYEF